MPTYDPSPNAVLLKQFRTGSNNYFEESYISGSSVLIHTDITGSVTGSNFTLAADTNTSYQHVLYQNSTFKLAASGSIVGGSSLVSRQENISVDTKAVVSGFGTQSDLNNATITFTGGNTLTVSNLNAFKLQQITVIYNSNVNSTSQFNFVYPEPNGQTSSTYTQYPIVSYWNNASPSVIQSNTNWNVSNSSGILTVQKTGLVSNTAAVFKIIV
jgi:hypothetical protein